MLLLNKNNLIENEIDDLNKTILLIDKIDTGKSLLKVLSVLKSNKVNVKYIFSIYNSDSFKIIDQNIFTIFSYNNINKLLKSKNMLDVNFNLEAKQKIKKLCEYKKSKIGYNCDLTNIKDIIREVDNLSSKIIVLKICSNKIENFSSNYGIALRKLANNYNFLIIDDIGVYNLKHINLENYKWCDMITTYNKNMYDLGVNFVLINSDNSKSINKNFLGVIGDSLTDSLGFHLTKDISDVDSLKKLI